MKDDVIYWAAGFTLIGVMVIIGLCRINVKDAAANGGQAASDLCERTGSPS